MLDHLAGALTEALHDEDKARATYRAILQRFRPVRPFANIVESEERHIQALLPLFARYGIPVPADRWPAQVITPGSVAQACQEGVQAEVENAAMYERLLAMTADYPDVQRVFHNLQQASQQNHLRAFQRCAARQTLVSPEPKSHAAAGQASQRVKASTPGCQGQGRRRRRRGRSPH